MRWHALARRDGWKHHVIFFRDQNVAPRQFLAFAERFGMPTEIPSDERDRRLSRRSSR
jgi:alpha-ketoglutarate-dependent taurine dioxygenase